MDISSSPLKRHSAAIFTACPVGFKEIESESPIQMCVGGTSDYPISVGSTIDWVIGPGLLFLLLVFFLYCCKAKSKAKSKAVTHLLKIHNQGQNDLDLFSKQWKQQTETTPLIDLSTNNQVQNDLDLFSKHWQQQTDMVDSGKYLTTTKQSSRGPGFWPN